MNMDKILKKCLGYGNCLLISELTLIDCLLNHFSNSFHSLCDGFLFFNVLIHLAKYPSIYPNMNPKTAFFVVFTTGSMFLKSMNMFVRVFCSRASSSSLSINPRTNTSNTSSTFKLQ